MQKIVCLIMSIFIIGLTGCSQNSSDAITNHNSSSITQEYAMEIAKQQAVNYYCTIAYVEKIKMQYGTENIEKDYEENEWVIELKGKYYPIDAYGSIIYNSIDTFAYSVCVDCSTGDVTYTHAY